MKTEQKKNLPKIQMSVIITILTTLVFISSCNLGSLNTNQELRYQQLDYCQLEVESRGNITLKSVINNKYVCADNYGNDYLIANRNGYDTWETFELFNLDHGLVALKSLANDKYVCVDLEGDNLLLANGESVDLTSTFELIELGNDQIALRSLANNQYVCAENFGNSALVANRDSIDLWETFTINFKNQNSDYWSYDGFTLKVQDDFNNFRDDLWWCSWSSFEGNLVFFNGPNNFSYEDGNMLIQIRQENSDWGRKYTGGEIRSHSTDFFYGRYEVRIKAPKGSGYAASMFTFNTWNANGTWDEIDIEVEGQYKDKISSNVWCGGNNLENRHEYVSKPYMNGSSTEEWNLYSFDWLPNEVIFYINGIEVRRENRHTFPYNGYSASNQTPAQVMMNFWITDLGTHFGGYNDGNVYPLTVRYDYFKYYILDSY